MLTKLSGSTSRLGRRRHRGIPKIALLLLLALVAAACGDDAETEGSTDTTDTTADTGGDTTVSEPKELTAWTTAVFPGELYLLDYVAQSEGFFEDHGLDVTFTTPQDGATAARLLLADEIQGWTTDIFIVLNANAQGQDIKMAGLQLNTNTYKILSDADADWATGTDFESKMLSLKGKTVGVTGIGAGTDRALIAALAEVGLTEEDVNRVGIGTTQAGVAQLAANRIDAYVEFAAAGTRRIESLGEGQLYVDLGQEAPESVASIPIGAIAVKGSFAEANPELVSEWMAAQWDAFQFIQENPEEAGQILADNVFNGEDLDLAIAVIEEYIESIYPRTLDELKVSEESFEAARQALIRQGAMDDDAAMFADVVLEGAR